MARRPEKRFRADSSSLQLERASFNYKLLPPEFEDFTSQPHPDGTIIKQSGNSTIGFVGGLEYSSPLGERHYFLEIHAARSTFRRSWQ